MQPAFKHTKQYSGTLEQKRAEARNLAIECRQGQGQLARSVQPRQSSIGGREQEGRAANSKVEQRLGRSLARVYYECVISAHKIYTLGLEEFRAKFDGEIKNGSREVPKGAQKLKGIKKRATGKGDNPLDGNIATTKQRQQRGEQHVEATKQYGNLVESGVGNEELKKIRDTIGSFLHKILGTEKKVGEKRKVSDRASASKFPDVDALQANLEEHLEKLDKYYQRINPVPRSRTPHVLADSAVKKQIGERD